MARYGAAMSDRNRQILAAVLEWTLAMGADAPVADVATDWLADDRGPPGLDFYLGEAVTEAVRTTPVYVARSMGQISVPPSRTTGPPAIATARKFATGSPDAAVGAARSAARTAVSLDALRQALEAFDGCSLKATAKSLSFYRGAAQAPLMIIGEAPGRDEDMEGKPFIGRAGQLLDRMLTAAGWSEADVHITNSVYWRPPGNRVPTPLETDICRPFLERQIELVAPRVLLLLGGSATKQIFRTDEGILNVRGQWRTMEFGNLKIPVLASLHPTYLLRTAVAKRQAWRDLLSVKEALKAPLSGPRETA